MNRHAPFPDIPGEGGSALTEAGDRELLAAAAGGDRDAFAALYERHAGVVYRFCLGRLGEREAAADACQETFTAVWSAAPSYAGSGVVLAWILGIARRKAADQRRVSARQQAEPLPEGGDEIGSPAPAPAVEEAVDVWAAMGRLPEGQQEVVLLTYGLGLSCQEAGQALGVPAGTVKSRLHAARAALARALEGEAVQP